MRFAEIATIGWINHLITCYAARELVAFDRFAHLAGWLAHALEQPAVQSGLAIPASG